MGFNISALLHMTTTKYGSVVITEGQINVTKLAAYIVAHVCKESDISALLLPMLSQFRSFKLNYLLLGHLYVSSCCVFYSRSSDTLPCISKGWCSLFIRGKVCHSTGSIEIGHPCIRSKIIFFFFFFLSFLLFFFFLFFYLT